MSVKYSTMVCSICKIQGHNKRACPTKASSSSSNKETSIITEENYNQSASEWFGSMNSIMKKTFINMIMIPKRHRDIGKILASATEVYVVDYLNDTYNRPIRLVDGEPYDAITNDDKPAIKIQIKFRMKEWHLETTRRNSEKNTDTNGTGHVAYRKDEFDVLLIFIPSKTFGITGSKIRCIPVSALINKDKPNQLITQINKKIQKEYDTDEKSTEILENLFGKKLN